MVQCHGVQRLNGGVIFVSPILTANCSEKSLKGLGAPRNINPAWAKTRLVIGLTNNLLLYQLTFNNNSPQTRQFLHDKMLKKKIGKQKCAFNKLLNLN